MTARRTRRAALLLAALACGACAYSPPERRVAFHVRFGGVARDASQPFTVTTPSGWSVTLTAAQVAIGPVYFRNGPPGAGTDEDDGRVVGEVLAQFTVDALDPNLGAIEGAGHGVTEPARSAEVRLYEANDGPIADGAGAGVAVAHVAGVAQRDGVTVRFDGALALAMGGGSASGYPSALAHRVAHIAADFTPDEGGTLTLRVDPSHWLDAVAFDPAGTPPDFTTRTATTQLLGGVGAASGVFAFTWEPPANP